MTRAPEVWLRGPVPGIDPVLQPVAHALLQIAEELPPALERLSPEQLWARPGTSAPIAYHVAHLAGSLDRLFTYARGESLNAAQRQALIAEGAIDKTRPALDEIIRSLTATLRSAIEQLRHTSQGSLFETREVGRARLPATTLGLLVHGAEHSARHAGQILTLIRVLEPTAP
jgi:uncharacterized damage-inducible protein DinB